MKHIYKLIIIFTLFFNTANSNEIKITDTSVSAEWSSVNKKHVNLYYRLEFTINKTLDKIGPCVQIFDSNKLKVYHFGTQFDPYSPGKYEFNESPTIPATKWNRGSILRFYVGQGGCHAGSSSILSNFVDFTPQEILN
tara:strand:+ start:101 stop:514 length:414 start_codon:yes stop_codon:yes gene_type:complete